MWWLIVVLMSNIGQMHHIEIGPIQTQAACEKFAENWLEIVAGPIIVRCEQRN